MGIVTAQPQTPQLVSPLLALTLPPHGAAKVPATKLQSFVSAVTSGLGFGLGQAGPGASPFSPLGQLPPAYAQAAKTFISVGGPLFGATLGAEAGAVAGAVVGYAAGQQLGVDPRVAMYAGAVIGATVGAGAGGAVGAAASKTIENGLRQFGLL